MMVRRSQGSGERGGLVASADSQALRANIHIFVLVVRQYCSCASG